MINNCMKRYNILAVNSKTHQRVVKQFLDGLQITELREANLHAQAFAQEMSNRTGQTWTAEITEVQDK